MTPPSAGSGAGERPGGYERELARAQERQRHEGVQAHADLPLFAPAAWPASEPVRQPSRTPRVRPLVRTTDPATSQQAALRVARQLGPVREWVYAAFRQYGPMTAKRAEQLSEFRHLGFSTVRKRVTELHRAGRLCPTGQVDEGCMVYEAVL